MPSSCQRYICSKIIPAEVLRVRTSNWFCIKCNMDQKYSTSCTHHLVGSFVCSSETFSDCYHLSTDRFTCSYTTPLATIRREQYSGQNSSTNFYTPSFYSNSSTATNNVNLNSSFESSNSALIGGIVAGIGALLAAFLVVFFVINRRRRRKKQTVSEMKENTITQDRVEYSNNEFSPDRSNYFLASTFRDSSEMQLPNDDKQSVGNNAKAKKAILDPKKPPTTLSRTSTGGEDNITSCKKTNDKYAQNEIKNEDVEMHVYANQVGIEKAENFVYSQPDAYRFDKNSADTVLRENTLYSIAVD